MHDGEIAPDDPRLPEVRVLFERHLAFAREVTPAGHVHALDIDGLLDPEVSFFSFRHDGEVLAIGALRMIDDGHGELKSMHTVEAARGRGIGRAMVEYLVGVARARGARRVSIETGTMPEFTPAREMYAALGFEQCEPFGSYTKNPHSICMTRWLSDDESAG